VVGGGVDVVVSEFGGEGFGQVAGVDVDYAADGWDVGRWC